MPVPISINEPISPTSLTLWPKPPQPVPSHILLCPASTKDRFPQPHLLTINIIFRQIRNFSQSINSAEQCKFNNKMELNTVNLYQHCRNESVSCTLLCLQRISSRPIRGHTRVGHHTGGLFWASGQAGIDPTNKMASPYFILPFYSPASSRTSNKRHPGNITGDVVC